MAARIATPRDPDWINHTAWSGDDFQPGIREAYERGSGLGLTLPTLTGGVKDDTANALNDKRRSRTPAEQAAVDAEDDAIVAAVGPVLRNLWQN